MKVSYYELLGMIQEGNAPKKIEVSLCNHSRIYVAEYDGEEFSHYILERGLYEDDTFRYYLAENFLESSMFNKCIKIIDKDIEKVSTYVLCDSDFKSKGENSLKAVEIIDDAFEEYSNVINDLISEVKKLKGE